MLDAASASAEEVLAAAATTTVPPAFFDALWAALERRSKPSAALARRASAGRRVSQR